MDGPVAALGTIVQAREISIPQQGEVIVHYERLEVRYGGVMQTAHRAIAPAEGPLLITG